MKLGLVLVTLHACGGGNQPASPPFSPDASSAVDAALVDAGGDVCNVLTQAGCTAGQKCSWTFTTDPTPAMGTSFGSPGAGAIACAPKGTVAIGAACTYMPAAHGGYDNCVAGAQCSEGLCKSICDDNGGAPSCTNATCATHDALFANTGSTSFPAGVCEVACNPLDDNDFDNVGTALTKSSTTCGTDPLEGCTAMYGHPVVTAFHCYHAPSGVTLLEHRQPTPATAAFACAPGYALAFASDATGEMTTACMAMCTPGDTYLGNPNAQLPNGIAPHACNGTDARGDFGAIPTGAADSNGEHCSYSWEFEEAATSSPVPPSPTSNTVGFCYDHSKYKYDPTGGTNDNTVIPPCAALPLHSTTTLDAVDLACVSTTVAFPFAGKHKVYISGRPELFTTAPRR